MLIAAAVPAASAQDVRRMSLGEPVLELFQSNESEGLGGSVSIQGRYSNPLGQVDLPGDIADYSQLFHSGLGLAVEGTLLFPLGRKWHIGPYLSLVWDSYEGERFDSGPTELLPETMHQRTVLVGPRFLLSMGRVAQLDLHLAFGAVHYSKLEGTFTTTAPQQGSVFAASTKFAFDFGIRFNILAGPLFFDAGFDLRSQAAPDAGDLPVDPKTMVVVGLEFGAGVHF